MTKNWKTFIGEKKLIKNYNLPIPLGLHKGRQSYRRREHPALFVGHFCPTGSGSTDLIESGSNPDPDPKHCKLMLLKPFKKSTNNTTCTFK
jgi:hypothetical protein